MITIARIKKHLGNNLYQVTIKGDGLYSLRVPVNICLAEKYNNNISEDLGAEDLELRANLIKIERHSDSKAKVQLILESNKEQNIAGLWLCVPQKILFDNKSKNKELITEPYLFQILGLKVVSENKIVATVTDYFETPAHGVLVIETINNTINNTQEVLIPLVEEHVQWDNNLDYIVVPHFHSFMES